jgi:hypothetical protein
LHKRTGLSISVQPAPQIDTECHTVR